LTASEKWQKDIVNAYLEKRIEITDEGIHVPGTSYLAHIWWEK